MADKSKIEWTDATWNPIRARNKETGKVGHFCVHKSPGCAHCYAERLQVRFGNPVRFAAQDADKVELFLDEETLTLPLRWQRRRRVFVCSMTDLFLEHVPEEWIDRVFAVMALASQHQFQVLTKRPERMLDYMGSIENGSAGRIWDNEDSLGGWRGALIEGQAQSMWAERNPKGGDPSMWLAVNLPLANVWLGTSIEGPAYWARAAVLEQVPAEVRFLSIEPLLEGLGTHVRIVDNMDWVIVGGESGPNARPMHPEWIREIRDRCIKEEVPFFFKQWGEWVTSKGLRPPVTVDHVFPDLYQMSRVGKKAAGRVLDGRTWDEYPA